MQAELPYGGKLAGKNMSAADTRDLCQSLDEQALQEVLGTIFPHLVHIYDGISEKIALLSTA